MSETVKPALTAEEWEALAVQRELPTQPGNICEVQLIPGLLVQDSYESVAVPDEARHALAALALYGQPFGFTREDVHGLRLISAGNEFFESLADRISALLPPEETK